MSWLVVHRLAAQTNFPPSRDYDSLLNDAKQKGKPMFLVIHQGNESFSPLEFQISKNIKDIIRKQFVSGTVQLDPDDFNHPLYKTYHLATPICLFTDSDGVPLLRHNKPITQEDTLIGLIDSVKTIAKGETMGKLMQQYKKGIRSRPLLMNLLKQYQAFDQYTDQQVLIDYLSQLSVQELNNFETVVFLLSCGPIYNSKTYRLARINDKMVDSLYAILPLPMRIRINNRIIHQTFREALDKQDYAITRNLGYFVGRSWRPHYLRGSIGDSYYPMEYKRLHRDTSSYIQMAQNYYNAFYYRVDPDSLAKLDFANERGVDIPQRGPVLDSAESIIFQRWIEKHRKRYQEEQAVALSFGARQLLDFGKNNPKALFDAISWQQRAIAFRPGHGQYHHTLAQLLYHVGLYAQAEAEQRQAIALSKSNKVRYQQMRESLKQLQSRSW